MTERLIVYLRGARIGLIEFDHEANTREFSYDGGKVSELRERMSDEGFPSPIYDAIRTVINRHIDQVRR